MLRWAAYEAGKTHARSTAPDHRYYAAVKDRQGGKRVALSEARKIIRQACRILTELGDDALTPPDLSDQARDTPGPRPGPPQPHSPMGTTAASSRQTAVSRCRPKPQRARRTALLD